MILLIDCNNFFVSCERVFRPDLQGKPVAVLSSNDGCIVARSNEVKALGIPMGVPVFQVRDLLRKNKVTLFSSNFTLYGDISDRVMKTLMRYCDDVDVYSIDEAFLNFKIGASDTPESWEGLALTMREDILRSVGVPVSIGIAPTKTLAKVASELAKQKREQGSGVASLLNESMRIEALRTYPIGEVWNIGRAHTRRLVGHNITMAGAFCALPTSWIQQHMGVMGLRIYYELTGLPCFGEMGVPSARKSIMSSRSFGTPTVSRDALYQALAGHVASVGASVRRQGSCASKLSIMIVRRERGDDMRYSYSREVPLSGASSDTRVLLKAANALLQEIYVPGARYIKGGVLVSGLMPRTLAEQPTLFSSMQSSIQAEIFQSDAAVFSCVDALNAKYGAHTVRLAAEPNPNKSMTTTKHDRISPAYTARWSDIARVG